MGEDTSLQLLGSALPEIRVFANKVKESIENPNFHVENKGDLSTTNLRVIAERLEDFAANLGQISGFLRLALNRYDPESLQEQSVNIKTMIEAHSQEKLDEISRFMDRNYVGTLDHEKGAVVSGRYVGAIPRIRDATTLLHESIVASEEVIANPASENRNLSIAEQMAQNPIEVPPAISAQAINSEHLKLFQEWLKEHLANKKEEPSEESGLPSFTPIFSAIEKIKIKLEAIPFSNSHVLEAQVMLAELSVIGDFIGKMLSKKE